MDDRRLLELLELIRNRFYGKYRGSVTQVDAGTLRIKAKVPAVFEDQESGWCRACVPYAGDQVGIAFLPEVGSGVWIEFEGGDVSYPIWSGCYWRSGEEPSDADAAVKVIVTVAPNKILIDDDQATITVTDSNQNTVTLDSNGITFERGSSSLVVGDSEVNINDGNLEVSA
jgi:uncharacterized protein involved in type VI secretion and phage assembly